MPEKVNKTRRRHVFLYLCFALNLSCRFPSRQAIPGSYIFRPEWGEVTLELRADGTTVESLRDSLGKRTLVGKWTFHEPGSISRGPCFEFFYDAGPHPKVDWCSSSVTIYGLNTVEIAVDPDKSIGFIKQ